MQHLGGLQLCVDGVKLTLEARPLLAPLRVGRPGFGVVRVRLDLLRLPQEPHELLDGRRLSLRGLDARLLTCGHRQGWRWWWWRRWRR